ncbi:SCO family protein [Algoriphagus chordae]|uniref:Protein SCO1/2 n=1 Tax=Algoriphagus chordae TaxID=237019 RepID=A0A2W7R8R3_9BACT|nr:SCO family protein [Algoriphagus chordae]PZX50619.1 protein SCO1/2 [Algoriphagus chordae]
MNLTMKVLNMRIRMMLFCSLLLLIACESPKQEISSRVNELPYYSEASFTPQWFDSKLAVPADFHSIPAFSLVNQNGKEITQDTYKNKIQIVSFFFTTCPGICPKMASNMYLIQEEFSDDSEVRLISFSVTPDYDTESVLREYADSKGVKDGKWDLLTGDRSQIYSLGRNAYFIEEDLGLAKSEDDFIHTENIVLIDKEQHIRGIYNGLNKTSIAQLVADVKTLESS